MKSSYEALVKERMMKQVPNELLGGTFRGRAYPHICKELNDKFNAKVKLSYNEKGKGKVVIPFDSDDDLMRLMSLFDKIN